jgi:endoribonuclease Dicer
MKLSYPIPEEQNTRGRKITDPAESTRNFGILTTQIVPPICDFPVFTRSGEVTVVFEFVSRNICLSSEQIEELQIFHDFTFSEVLRLIKYPLLFDPIKSNCKYLVVPVNEFGDKNCRDIDWDFVHLIKRQKESPLRLISEEERKNFVFNPDIYNDAVVIPWYRKDKPQFFFYVAEICDNLTPKSLFPDEGYETFEKYYLSKYNIRIMNTSQPLLDVDHTSARLNLLTPRYVNRKGISLPTSTAKTKKEKRENLQQKQILVPELCIVHPFPGSLWRKAVCLPCMLYRLNSLLVAEQLRIRVAKESGVGIVETNPEMSWPPLDFGWTLAQVMAQNLEQENESKDVESNELVKEVHETWDFMTSEENLIAIENKENDCDLLNTSSEENANVNNELVIDTFDPNNYNIDDELYDFEDDEEMENMEWTEHPINIIGGPNGFSSTTVPIYWGFNSNTNNNVQIREIENNDSSDDNILVRIGSPSYFNVSALNEREGRGREWDFDDQMITSSVYNIGLPGLEVISCADGLNIDGLSKDLAKCHVEVFDSSDETSDIEDLDSDDEDDDNEGLVQSNQRKNMIPNRTFNNRNKISDILRYELLDNSPPNDQNLNDSNEKMIRTLHKEVFAEDNSDENNCVEETENLSQNSTENFFNENNVEKNDFYCAVEGTGLTELLNDYIKEEKNDDLDDFEVSDEECEQKDMQLEENFNEVLNEEKTSHEKETKILCVDSIWFVFSQIFFTKIFN